MNAGRKREPIVARRLREARIAAGLSQRELGVRAGMDPSVASPRVNQYERAKHLPDPLTLERLGTVLNCPLPYFYADDDGLAQHILAFCRANGIEQGKLATLASRIIRRVKNSKSAD